ncbi:MAG TPA: GTP cyclohydrolase [Blastocatellia bacterium]|nr:GTP cyclohydrolase [Blastocatellia bacterium]
MIVKLAERELRTKFGVFSEVLYYDGQRESIALIMGEISGGQNVLCRLHSACIGGHVFNSIECECAAEMAAAQEAIRAEGRGIIIYLDQEGQGNGHLALIESIKYKKKYGQAEAYRMAGFKADVRDYRPAVEIITDLGIKSVVLLTGNPAKAVDLTKAGVAVSGTKPLDPKDAA